MHTDEARRLGSKISNEVSRGEIESAMQIIGPILRERTHFRLLDIIGTGVGQSDIPKTDLFLDEIASTDAEGGWVVIGSALRQRIEDDLEGALERSLRYIMAADVWYGSDILGERVPGPALVDSFDRALEGLKPWRRHTNHWVRRSLGVSVHYWAKRSSPDRIRAGKLLDFLEPMFEEWDLPAVKGIGWGLKTLGRHHPDMVSNWLREQIVDRGRRYRAPMVRKALTYLPTEMRIKALGDDS
jgi:hypothetical protein